MSLNLENIISNLAKSFQNFEDEKSIQEIINKTTDYIKTNFFDENGKLKNEPLVFLTFESHGHEITSGNKNEVIASAILLASWKKVCDEKDIKFSAGFEFNDKDVKILDEYLKEKTNIKTIQGTLIKWISQNELMPIFGYDNGRLPILTKDTDGKIIISSDAKNTVEEARKNIKLRNEKSVESLNNKSSECPVIMAFYGDLHHDGMKKLTAGENTTKYFLTSNEKGKKAISPYEFLKGTVGLDLPDISIPESLLIIASEIKPKQPSTDEQKDFPSRN